MKENRMEPTKDVGVWIRVSTDEQAQGDSPEHHELRARAYAQAKGWRVREVYDLAGVSGKTVMEHAECRRMMDDVRRGHISGLIFSKLARLARNTIELLKFSEFFHEHNADLVSLGDSIDTSTPMGRMFFTVNAAQAQMEREEIAARVAASVPIRAKLGKPMGGLAPFGYRWDGKKLVPDPKDAPVRKLVYELFAEHKRKKTVARILNERGFRTRDGKTRKGGLFSDTTVARLIADPTAKGEHRANYTKSLGEKKQWKFKPEHEWVVNKVEPIVSVELWERCNALLEARKTKGERPAKTGKNPFSGFVACSCGKKMYVPFNTPKWVCYSCRNKIPAVDLENAFRDELQAFMVSAEKVQGFLATARDGADDKKALLAGLKSERDRVKAEADKCFELYQNGALTVAQFKERFQPLDARKKEIEREIPRMEGEIAAQSADEVSCDFVAKEGRSFYEAWPNMDDARKRAVVEMFLKGITVGEADMTINLFTLPVFEKVTDGQHTDKGVLPIGQIALTCQKPKPLGYPSQPKTLGEHIRKRRIDLGLFQREVAAKMGANTTSVTNWEKGRAEPEIRFLPAILGFLGYDPRPNPTSVGGQLVAYRLARGWARPRLAAELRVDPSTLARWETGKREPWGEYVGRVNALLSAAGAAAK